MVNTVSRANGRTAKGPISEAARLLSLDAPETRSLGARLAPWLFGVAVVAVVVVVGTHWGEERALLELLRRISPVWLLAATLLQSCTYVADASTLRGTLAAGGWPRPLRALVGLSLAKLFMDQAVPSGGVSGTLLIMRSLDRRGVPRGITLGAVILDLLAYYVSYVVALVIALAVAAALHGLSPWLLAPAAAFALLALGITSVLLLLVHRGHGALPRWLRERPPLRILLDDVDQMPREPFRNMTLFARCFAFESAIFVCDAATLWVLLYALGEPSPPALVFAAFMLATLARTIGFIPGGLGTFEGASVALLHVMGVSVPAALAATLLFRGLSFWLPMAPGLLVARRESRRVSAVAQ